MIARLLFWCLDELFDRCLGTARESDAIMALVVLQFVLFAKLLMDRRRSKAVTSVLSLEGSRLWSGSRGGVS